MRSLHTHSRYIYNIQARSIYIYIKVAHMRLQPRPLPSSTQHYLALGIAGRYPVVCSSNGGYIASLFRVACRERESSAEASQLQVQLAASDELLDIYRERSGARTLTITLTLTRTLTLTITSSYTYISSATELEPPAL